MYPVILPKFDIGFVVKNCDYESLFQLEPWCSTIYVDYEGLVYPYIVAEQENTTEDLTEKVKFIGKKEVVPNNNIIVEFDIVDMKELSMNFISNLSAILKDSGEEGEMEFDIFNLKISSLKSYEKKLVKNENNNF
jgi:hypothetical protein